MRLNISIPNQEFLKILSIKNQLIREIESLKLIAGVRKKV